MTTKDSPKERHLYAVNWENGKLRKITSDAGTHNVSISTKRDIMKTSKKIVASDVAVEKKAPAKKVVTEKKEVTTKKEVVKKPTTEKKAPAKKAVTAKTVAKKAPAKKS